MPKGILLNKSEIFVYCFKFTLQSIFLLVEAVDYGPVHHGFQGRNLQVRWDYCSKFLMSSGPKAPPDLSLPIPNT